MTVRDDPEDTEIDTLTSHVRLDGMDVLEVGCGDGRLTLKYADRTKSVQAIDPLAASIRSARKAAKRDGTGNLHFRIGNAESLPFSDGSFDVVLFSWSLCCVDIPVMGRALDEARRVLKPGGAVASLQPSLYQPFGCGGVDCIVEGKFGTTVDDERYRQARLVLKYSTLIERKFDFVFEEEFTIKTYCDSAPEALKYINQDRKEAYRGLSQGQKKRALELVKSQRDGGKVVLSQNVILTVVRKPE